MAIAGQLRGKGRDRVGVAEPEEDIAGVGRGVWRVGDPALVSRHFISGPSGAHPTVAWSVRREAGSRVHPTPHNLEVPCI